MTHKTVRNQQADAATGVEEVALAEQADHLKVIEGWGLRVVRRWAYPRMNRGALSLWTTHCDGGKEACASGAGDAHGWFQTCADEAHSFFSGRSLEPGKEEGTPAGGGRRVDVNWALS